MLKPLILELDEPLTESEKMIGVKTIGIESEEGRVVGYVAVIKDFGLQNAIRYGNLKAVKYDKKKLGNSVV